ncbi:hypothetical protein Q5752_003912 [Cryptotrichosporon argae]
MNDYDFRPSGKLKLKGDDSKKKKKHKSSSSSSSARAHDAVARSHAAESKRGKNRDADAGGPDGDAREGEAEAGSEDGPGRPQGRKLTATERKFEEVQRARRAERAVKLGAETHKERVDRFNKKLDAETEHHDLPRISAA